MDTRRGHSPSKLTASALIFHCPASKLWFKNHPSIFLSQPQMTETGMFNNFSCLHTSHSYLHLNLTIKQSLLALLCELRMLLPDVYCEVTCVQQESTSSQNTDQLPTHHQTGCSLLFLSRSLMSIEPPICLNTTYEEGSKITLSLSLNYNITYH